ncbi:heme/copper-type cytochrome/quinol oxidase subunit 4 [Sporosarcina luteola]|nr:heme/copper-type cytochrome/quinol oxidase subunit 4 [Sporosarcina luteola]
MFSLMLLFGAVLLILCVVGGIWLLVHLLTSKREKRDRL